MHFHEQCIVFPSHNNILQILEVEYWVNKIHQYGNQVNGDLYNN